MGDRLDDWLIVGGGCAGLSLAVELLDRTPRSRRITLIEPRQTYVADRHWCFWSNTPTRWNGLSDHRWTRWSVRTARTNITRSAPNLAYMHVPSDRFYAAALARLADSDRVALHLGVTVSNLEDRGDRVVAETDQGIFQARLAFDSRPDASLLSGPLADPRDVRLLQHFVGHVVETGKDVFDPDRATLMDFRVRQDLGIHFVYVLPFGPTRALVESTFFSPQPHPSAIYEDAIVGYLQDVLELSDFRVTRKEQGVLPMSTERVPARPQKRICRIGVSGGATKPSTGYAFVGIQRQAISLASRLALSEFPETPSLRNARELALDRMFLSFLSRYPEEAPSVFAGLFENTEPNALARFLSDSGTPLDALRVMRASASAPLIKEIARSVPRWLRAD